MGVFKIKWDELVAGSEYSTYIEILNCIDEKVYDEAREGIQALIKNHKDNIEDELYEHLKGLMKAILLLKLSGSIPENLIEFINKKRNKIDFLKRENNFVNQTFIKNIWDDTFAIARNDIALEIEIDADSQTMLSWHEVFEKEFTGVQ